MVKYDNQDCYCSFEDEKKQKKVQRYTILFRGANWLRKVHFWN